MKLTIHSHVYIEPLLKCTLQTCASKHNVCVHLYKWIQCLCTLVQVNTIFAFTCTSEHNVVNGICTFYIEQRLQAEAEPWKSKLSALHVMAQKIVEQYRNDDVTQIKTTVADVDKRWTVILDKYVRYLALLVGHPVPIFCNCMIFNFSQKSFYIKSSTLYPYGTDKFRDIKFNYNNLHLNFLSRRWRLISPYLWQ